MISAMPKTCENHLRRGDGLPMSGLRAKRTAEMIEAAMTGVEANRSCLLRSAFCRVMARRIARPSVNPPF
jgi:hypothetical protein